MDFRLIGLLFLGIIKNAIPSVKSEFEKVDKKIIKGHIPRRFEATFIVSIQIYGRRDCSGSLIEQNWLLTAAHCVARITDCKHVVITAGRFNFKNQNEYEIEQTRTLKFYRIHPKYEGSLSPYDIAILYVDKPFKWTDFVQPVFLPQEGIEPIGFATAFGWGATCTKPRRIKSQILLQVTMPIISIKKCRELLDTKRVADSNICTANTHGGVCMGDSGGPLTQKRRRHSRERILVGIISWGVENCENSDAASVFVKVSALIDWINDEIYNKLY